MSEDWNVHCLDCNETHLFNDANHKSDLMLALCRYAPLIATLSPMLVEDDRTNGATVSLETMWGRIDVRWFAEHAGHKLLPKSEYGDFLDQCGSNYRCVGCDILKRCRLKEGHTGIHDDKRKA